MPNLRPSSARHVLDELAASPFGVVGFQVTFPDSGDLVSIVSTVQKASKFTIASSATGNPLVVRMSPGEYKTEDTVRCDSFTTCLSLIQPWARRIHEDLRIQDPNLAEFQAFRDSLEAHIKGSVKDEASLFSDEEVRELSLKLDALEVRLQEMEEKHQLTEKELWTLRQVINEAKTDLPAMPKGVWYRTAGGKVWEAVKKAASTGEAKQLLADAARKLIGL